MRILHLSDLHFGVEDKTAIAAVTRFVADERPDMVIVSGDLSAVGSAGELEDACGWLASLGPPVVATPGNHDVPYHEVLPRFRRPFERYVRASAGRLADGWRSDDLFVCTVNTARGWQLRPNWALGAISRAQRRAACAALAQAPVHALKVVVTHHPLLVPPNSPVDGRTSGGKHAAHRMIDAGADLMLSGHLHVMQALRIYGRRGNAVFLISGTLSCRLRGAPAGFLMIERPTPRAIAVTRFNIVAGTVGRAECDRFDLAPDAGARFSSRT